MTYRPSAMNDTQAHDEKTAERLKALAHPARLRILRALAARGTCVCGEIVEVMPLAQATVSQHLKVLTEAGFVQGRIDGRNSCYCLDPAVLRALRDEIDRLVRELTSERSDEHA